MRRSQTVLASPDYSVRLVTCTDDHRRWSAPEPADTFGLVLPRRGRFRMRSDGTEHPVDVAQGYLQVPGREQCFAHPAGGDVCTFLSLGETLWHEILGERRPPETVRVDAATELSHRLLLRSAHEGADPSEHLVWTLMAAARAVPSDGANAGAAPARARLGASAREAVLEGDPALRDLVSLARALQVSPAHLSRVFKSENGVSLTAFRNRVRASRALARLEAGDGDLAALAADVGFADQAHLTRTIRSALGTTPARVREAFRRGRD